PNDPAPNWLLTPFPGEAYIQKVADKLKAAYGVRLESQAIPLRTQDGFPRDSILHLLRLHYD
ncbi:MAG: hypothetical protein OSB14_07965, partial [Planctomycetota bacterium]|nr:hypothetical protein [Planctomycetota bacterium]